jgi:DNA-directed RNA polymerase specialized sigma24 family protein
MSTPTPLPDLLARLRTGDVGAVREFVGAYEPFTRRAIRRRAARGPRYAVADSDDLCQSVLGSFLIRFAAGEYDLDGHADLERLIVTIVRNKVAALARREAGQPRNHPRMRLLESGEDPSGASLEDRSPRSPWPRCSRAKSPTGTAASAHSSRNCWPRTRPSQKARTRYSN